jgi:hypothetical protein
VVVELRTIDNGPVVVRLDDIDRDTQVVLYQGRAFVRRNMNVFTETWTQTR